MKYAMLLTSFLVLAGLPVHAGDRKPFGTGELPDIMKAFDVNGDGKLGPEERQAFEAAIRDKAKANLIKKFDTDGDGVRMNSRPPVMPPARRSRTIAVPASMNSTPMTTDSSPPMSSSHRSIFLPNSLRRFSITSTRMVMAKSPRLSSSQPAPAPHPHLQVAAECFLLPDPKRLGYKSPSERHVPGHAALFCIAA